VHDAARALQSALVALAERHPAIGDVRVVGLACGVELVADRTSREPDAARARTIKERLRHRGVLVGTTGREGNILKIRPPLAFTGDHVPVLTDALDAAVTETA
jgi:4-aminobutyrate aminotransferase-like enzyme